MRCWKTRGRRTRRHAAAAALGVAEQVRSWGSSAANAAACPIHAPPLRLGVGLGHPAAVLVDEPQGVHGSVVAVLPRQLPPTPHARVTQGVVALAQALPARLATLHEALHLEVAARLLRELLARRAAIAATRALQARRHVQKGHHLGRRRVGGRHALDGVEHASKAHAHAIAQVPAAVGTHARTFHAHATATMPREPTVITPVISDFK